jgi:hypothetical protein
MTVLAEISRLRAIATVIKLSIEMKSAMKSAMKRATKTRRMMKSRG